MHLFGRHLPPMAVPLALAALAAGIARAEPVFNVLSFGARADASAESTDAFNAAIGACRHAGGGTVEVPAGSYLTGPLDLCDHLTLRIESGALVRFVADRTRYPEVLSRWEGLAERGPHPLIFAEGCRDVAIEGAGVVDGNGPAWWATMDKAEKGNERPMDIAGKPGYANSHRIRRRPPLVQFKDCDGVRIEGVTFQNAPFWTVHLLYSQHIDVGGCRLLNPPDSPNTDALNADSCSHVIVHDCYANVGDDGFGIKAGRDAEGRKVARPTEYLTYLRCKVGRAHSICAIGSEPSGGVRHIRFIDCEGEGTDNGIRIKTARGRGGVIEDVVASGFVMRGVRNAIVVTSHYVQSNPEPFSERTPVIRGIRIDHVRAVGSTQCCVIDGLQEAPISDVVLEHLDLAGEKGVRCSHARNVSFSDVRVASVESDYLEEHCEGVRRSGWTGPLQTRGPRQ